MELYKEKMKDIHGYLVGDIHAVDAESSTIAINYKKQVCKNYKSLNQKQMETKLGGNIFYVTRKYDGELNVLFYNGSEAFVINRSGRVRTGLPCTDAAQVALQAAGVKRAIIPCELIVDESKGRTRVFDVLKAVADKKALASLQLVAFDVVEIDGTRLPAQHYGDVHAKLEEIFSGATLCTPVRYQKVESMSAVKQLYTKWVDEEGAEGLVVRSDLAWVFKIKPRYTIDAAVIGFSEGTGDAKGQVRTLLLALMPEEGKFQIVGRTGNGFSDEFRTELMEKLTPKIVPSRYVETDSNHVAFHMIKPDMVIELFVNDIIFETPSGSVPNNVLAFTNGQYRLHSAIDGISLVFPIFERIRDDKKCVYDDVRLSQIFEFAYVPQEEQGTIADAVMPASEVILRDVYKKETGSKLMVQKFMVWKTNKEHTSNYPAYVMHYTNFSSERKEPLQRDIRVSSSEEQIMEMVNEFIDGKVKKGWNKV